MAIKNLLLDLDDTIAVILPQYKNYIIGNSLKEFGVNTTLDNIDSIWQGHDRDNILIGLGVDPVKFWEVFDRIDNPELRLKSTVVHRDYSAIRKLEGDGYATGLVTGSPESVIPLKLAALGSEKMKYVSTFDPTGEREKPNPWGIIECMKILGAKPEETVYIGNATNDVLAAKNAGVLDVFIRRDPQYKLRTHPTVSINSLYEIEKVLDY